MFSVQRILSVLVIAVLCAACGYRVLGNGAAGPGSLPLWVAPVDDDAAEPLFGVRLGRHLSREAVNAGAVFLARREHAELELHVRVDQVREVAAAFVVGDVPREYLLTGVVSASVSRPGDEVLWKGSGIRAEREFSPGQNVNQTQVNKDAVLELLAGDLAREVLRRVELVSTGTVR